MNKKLSCIFNMLEPAWKNIVDVGCDHAYLSLESYKLKQDRFFYNVENKIGPLNNAKKYQEDNPNAAFILSDGLDYFQDKNISIDCCVIAGMGGYMAVDILNRNHIFLPNLIVQVTNNNEQFEQWILDNNYQIMQLEIVHDQQYCYWIYKIKK